MRRIPIHTKLIAALTVPLVALLVVVGLEFLSNSSQARDANEQADLALVATGPGGLISALQDERNITGLVLVGSEGLVDLPCDTMESCRAATDTAMENFMSIVEDNSRAQQAYAEAIDSLNDLQDIRSTTDNDPTLTDNDPSTPTPETNREAARAVFDRFSVIVTALLNGNTRLAADIDDPDLRKGAELIDLSSRQSDTIAHIVAALMQAYVLDEGRLSDPILTAQVGGLEAELEKGYNQVKRESTGPYEAPKDKMVQENDALGFERILNTILEEEPHNIPLIDQVMPSVSSPRDQSWYGFRDAVESILRDDADRIVGEANQERNVFIGVALLSMLLAICITVFVSLSITRPLRSLTRQASEMAHERLPEAVQDILETPLGDDVTVPHLEPITVRTRDEVADVAQALNTVQDSAVELAVEQAVLRRNIADSFVNLGRRNQNLLGRQLDFITELEQHETDPDTLANLFRLDHLATRMRRNAESLLVLAGIEPPRKWAAPVRLTDVIRAALGEVEDYQRVTVRAVEPATIMGTAAADLAHLLAELIENALTFSPPDQTVELRGRAQPDGYTVAVIDSGLGMGPEEITRANRRLAGAESFTIAPSKYLGHYVAGNLAARHTINVQLHNSPGQGITATVHIPPDLLTTDQVLPGEQAAAPALQAQAGPIGHLAQPNGMQSPPALGAASQGALPPGPAPAQPAAGMTESGLTRRTPASQRREPTSNNDELLKQLADYAGPPNQGQGGDRPTFPADASISPVTGTPALSELPPFPLTPPGGQPHTPGQQAGGWPPANQQPPSAQPPLGQGPFGPPAQPGNPGQQPQVPMARRLPTGQTPAVPPLPSRRQTGQTPAVSPGQDPRRMPTGQTPAVPPLPSRRSPAKPGGGAPQMPGTPGRGPVPPGTNPLDNLPPSLLTGEVPIQSPRGPGSGGDDASRTPGAPGLARRVRGAQLPNTTPLGLRRGAEGPPAAPAGPAGGAGRPAQPAQPSTGGPALPSRRGASQPAGNGERGANPASPLPSSAPFQQPQLPQRPSGNQGWANETSAKSVYSFLSDFTSGVKRGLSESEPDAGTEPPTGDEDASS